MDIPEFWPAQRDHGGCRVQLHSAATQRDHAMVQGNVSPLQLVDVAHHLGLGAVGVEDLFGEYWAGAP